MLTNRLSQSLHESDSFEEVFELMKSFFDSLYFLNPSQNIQETPFCQHDNIHKIQSSMSMLFKNPAINNKTKNLTAFMSEFYNQCPEYFSEKTLNCFNLFTQEIGYHHGYAEALRTEIENVMQEESLPFSAKEDTIHIKETPPSKNKKSFPYAINIVIDITDGHIRNAVRNIRNKYQDALFRYYTWDYFIASKDNILKKLAPRGKKIRIYLLGHCGAGLKYLYKEPGGNTKISILKIAKAIAPFLNGSPDETVSILGCKAASSGSPDLENSAAYSCMNNLYQLIYQRKQEELNNSPEVTVTVTARTATMIPSDFPNETFRTIQPIGVDLYHAWHDIKKNFFSKSLSYEQSYQLISYITQHHQEGSKLVFIHNQYGIVVQEAYTQKPYYSPLPPPTLQLTARETFINALVFYKKIRKKLQEFGYTAHSEINFRLFKIGMGTPASTKISAAKKVIQSLKTYSDTPINELTGNEIAALNEGELGKLIDENKHFLPLLLLERLGKTIFINFAGKR